MTINKTVKKIIFFWVLFNLIGYLSFLIGFTPSIESKDQNGNVTRNYLITPKYSNQVIHDTDINGHSEVKRNMMFPDCSNCNYIEKNNFYPFHSFTYSVYRNNTTKGFVGIWGYYGHYEFLFYMILPLLILGLRLVYNKFIK